MGVDKVYMDIWGSTLTIPSHNASFFPLKATPYWTSWCTLRLEPNQKGSEDSNLFLVQPSGSFCGIVMILSHKHNDHFVKYAAHQVPLQWNMWASMDFMDLYEFYETPLCLLHLTLLDNKSGYK